MDRLEEMTELSAKAYILKGLANKEKQTRGIKMKKWIIPIMLFGCLLFNCLFVGGYQIYEAARLWLKPSALEFNLQELETSDLIELRKQFDSEIKFRQGK